MPGAIIGDVCGSIYEGRRYKGGEWDMPLFTERSHFTDDTVMTVACMEAMEAVKAGKEAEKAFQDSFHAWGRRYPHAGYGHKFKEWIMADNPQPYGSFGNGSAMRVSPVAWMCDNLVDVLKYAAASAKVTHDHPEGVKGAQAVAAAVFLARSGKSKEEIRQYVSEQFGYDLNRSLIETGKDYCWSSQCQKSVPEAIIAFLDSHDFESAIRGAIWLGGDADTQAAIAGSIAHAFYGNIPEWMRMETRKRLDRNLAQAMTKFETISRN